MRKTRPSVWASGLALATLCSWGLAFAQEFFVAEPVSEPRPEFDLPLVNPGAALDGSTFWLYSSFDENGTGAPYPYDPYSGTIEMYSLPDLPGQYLIADTPTDFTQLQSLHWQMAQLESGGGMVMSSSIEFPGEGGEGGGEGWVNSYTPIEYGTNDLYLTMVPDSLTNGTATLAIHNPEGITNPPPAWLVWAVTNLSYCTDPWAWDADNWEWVAATTSGQTNVTVSLLSEEACFYRLADPLNDFDGDGIPDYYTWLYFGHQRGWASDNSRAGDDYDGDGLSNGLEYTNNTDPNSISFTAHVGYGQVSVTNPTATVAVLGGVPAEMAILVDSTNFNSPNWQPYTGTPTVSLPNVEGPHQIWMALRARVPAASPVWQGFTVTLDQTPPPLVITSPTNELTFKPYLQLQGWSVDNVLTVSCSLSNAAGIQTNLTGYVTGRTRGAAVTNHFQCFDLELTNGVNDLTLQVMDLAGNSTTTNLSVTFDPSGDTNAPGLTLLWPTDGMQLGTDQFTLRALVDDETAMVELQLSNAGGTNVYTGLVERNGAVWVEDIALEPSTNWVTVTAVDTATNSTSTNFIVVRGSVSATINEPADLTQPFVQVTGIVSDSSYAVWVNGVRAEVIGNDWTAANVPLTGSGTATMSVELVPPGGSTTNGPGGMDPSNNNPNDPNGVQLSIQPEKPARIELVHGEWEAHDFSGSHLGPYYSWDYLWKWDKQTGGFAQRMHTEPMPGEQVTSGLSYWVDTSGVERFEHWLDTPTNVISTDPVELAAWFWPGFSVKGPMANGKLAHHWEDGDGVYHTVDIARDVEVELSTGGRADSRTRRLFIASACATEKLAGGGTREIAADAQYIASFGRQGADSQAPATHPDNVAVPVNVTAPAAYYEFGVGQSKYRFAILANGVDLSTNTPTFCLGQKITFEARIVPSLEILNHVSHWKFPERFVNQSNMPCSSCSVNYTINTSLLTNLTTSCWFTSGGGGTASIGSSLQLTNGKYVTIAAKGEFLLVGPTVVSNEWTCGGVNMFLDGGGDLSEIALRDNAGVGMEFINYVKRPDKFSGYAWHTQLIKRTNSYNTIVSSPTFSTGGTFWLDNIDPYKAPVLFPLTTSGGNPADPVRPVLLPDSPGLIAGMFGFKDRAEMQDDFHTYLRWRPDLLESIPVTFMKIEWGWHGKAVKSNSVWSLSISNWYGPTFIPTTADPSWDTILDND